MKTNMINTNSVIKSICAVVVLLGMSVSAWGTDITTADFNFGSAAASEDFEDCSTSAVTTGSSSTTTLTSMTDYGVFTHCYIGKTTECNFSIQAAATPMSSKYLQLVTNTNTEEVAFTRSFTSTGAFTFKIAKSSKAYVGLYQEAPNSNAIVAAKTSVYLHFTSSKIQIHSGSAWVDVLTTLPSEDVLEIAVIYNNTTSNTTYGNDIPLSAKRAHIYVNGTAIMNSSNPNEFTIPGGSLTYFRVGYGGTATTIKIDDINIYDALPTGKFNVTYDGNGSTGGTVPTDNTDYSSGDEVTVSDNSGSLVRTGYTFDGWNTQADGKGTSYAATGSATFDITANTTLYAKWNLNSYTLAVAGVDNIAISSTTPSVAEGSSTSVNYGTTVTLSHGDPDGGRQWGGWNVYKTGDASTTVSVNSDNQFTMPDYNVTVSANLYADFRFSCAELTLTPKLVTASTPIFITSAASKMVRSQDSILIVGSGLTPSKALEFPDLPSKFSIRSRANGTLSTKADGTIDTVAYIFYTPGSGDTSDGIDKLTGIKVKVDGAKPFTQSLDQVIIGRHVATNFVIAAKFADNKWYALPADKANGNLTPVSIRVNSESAPTTAYCENTNSFTLYQDNTSNSPKVVLGLTNFRNDKAVSYALFGSSSGSTIGKSDGTVTGSIGDQYKWTLVQQATSVSGIGDVKYQITVTNNAQPIAIRTYSGSTNWGLHANSGTLVTEMRLLTLEEVQPLTLSVMEWGTDAIVVSYPNGGSASSVQTAIGDATPSSVTMTSLGGDLYKISTISGLQSNPSKPLYIMATESGTSKQAVLSIPLIVTDAKTEAQLRESLPGANATERNKTAKYIDVIIRDGGTMTTGTASGNFADLYIYPGGKAIVSNNMSFGTIYMRGGYSFLDNKATYKYPDLCVKEGTITTEGVTYDMYIDNRLYYKFAMPTNVTLASVTDETGSEDFPVWVKHYDGAKRASGAHVNGWEWYGDEVGQESFKAGVGYEITAKPRVSGRPLAIIRFPVKSGNITSDANDTTKVAVTNYGKSAYDSGNLAANNVGWNLVGNPYLTAFKATSDTSMIIDKSYEPADVAEGETWDGTYKWVSSPARFVTVPYDMQNDFHHEYVKNCTIPAFSAFFIQVVESGIFKMAGTRTQAAAPWRYDAAQKSQPEMHLDVLLHGNNEAVEAKAGLIIHDKYEGGLKDFEDVEQWFVDQNEQKTYTFANGTALAYNLLNEQAAMQIIPMGYIATAAGEHTYSLDESNDVSGLEHLWLTDYMTGVTTDLLVHGYSFTTEAGRFDERFAISATFNRDEVATEIVSNGDDSQLMSIGIYHDGNTLTLRGLPENSSAYVYDMTGKLITSGKNLHNVASFNIAAQGVYNIRVVDGEKAVTLRCVLQ